MLQRFMGLLGCAALLATATVAEERQPYDLVSDPGDETDPALVEGAAAASKALQDTVWIADWTFDVSLGSCTEEGWVHQDLRLPNDGSNYWSVSPGYGNGSHAAVLRKHDLCWVRDGYGNGWDHSVVLKYEGSGATLSFHLWSDPEPGFDVVTVEADSLGMSESRVDFRANPYSAPARYRDRLLSIDGDHTQGMVVSGLALPDNGPGIHEVYIRFESDGGYSDEDGLYASAGNYGMIVDDIVVTGGLTYSEDFSCGAPGCLNPKVQLLNTASTTPFGEWGRVHYHISDNDKCTENTSCAWLWSDPTLPAYFGDMAFGPDGVVVRKWLDNQIVSPWVSLAGTRGATRTVLSFRRFPGNNFGQGRIVQAWRVRSRSRRDNTDTPALGDSIECLSRWGHATQFNSLSTFTWVTAGYDMTPYFDDAAPDIQLSFRVGDWNHIADGGVVVTLNTGPGPYLDRVRIGRLFVQGPVLTTGADTRTQAQDCFATVQNAITPGEHFAPSTDRFGSCAFSMGADLGVGWRSSQSLITGDSITIEVQDVRQAGGITSVRWYGAIVAGPHAGKAPAPYAPGASGFFEITPDSMRSAGGSVVANHFTADLDDTYFRGGDVLEYIWTATDAGGGFASMPAGLIVPPVSVAAAEAATGGLFEVSFLPAIDWSPAYLQRIAADAHGDLDPTPSEVAQSSQARCVLYYQKLTSQRRGGPGNKTSFLHVLDVLGYRNAYDVYDVQGYGNTNNQLAGRATLDQLAGYELLIQDDGRSNLAPNIPVGTPIETQKLNQAQFYRDWLASAAAHDHGRATLWILGEGTAYEGRAQGLFSADFGAGSIVDDQAVITNPDVRGLGSFGWSNGWLSNFQGDLFTLDGGCPNVRRYDGFSAGGTAVVTHRYETGATAGPAAVLMNSNPAQHWDTVLMGFAWFDIVDVVGQEPRTTAHVLASKILAGAVSQGACGNVPEPTPADRGSMPHATWLHPNVPNPFNPATKLAFDLATSGRVRLEIYDVAGHRVRAVLDATLPAGFGHAATWNGLDDAGRRAPSGVYFARLRAADAVVATRRLVLLK